MFFFFFLNEIFLSQKRKCSFYLLAAFRAFRVHQGQVFKAFLQAVRDRSLFKSEVRWVREKSEPSISCRWELGLQNQQQVLRKAQQWGYPCKTSALARSTLCCFPAYCKPQDLVP